MTDAAKGLVLPPDTAFLSAADRQMESFLNYGFLQRAFEESLLNNLLFEETVLVPDIFYFISGGLDQHIKSRSKSDRYGLLEAGLMEGCEVPAFRDASTTSFVEAYQKILDSKIAGLLPPVDCHQIALRLDHAARRAQAAGTFKSTPWPADSVGAAFEARLSSFFQPADDQPPTDDPMIGKIWRETTIWRRDCLTNARLLGGTYSPPGFRRGDYMAEIGKTVGLSGRVHDVSELYNSSSIPPAKRAALKTLCLWMNECYEYNLAKAFGVRPNWARFDPMYSSVTLAAMERYDRNAGGPKPEIREEKIVAELPSPKVLLGMDASVLLQAKSGKAGSIYFAALREWRSNPQDDGLLMAVQAEFKEYARSLREKAGAQRQYDTTLLQQSLVRLEGPDRKMAGAITAAASSLLSTLKAFSATPLIAAGGVAYATYLWIAGRRRDKELTIRATIELNS